MGGRTETVEERVVRLVREASGDEVALSSSLNDLGLDSLDRMELVMDVEDEFSLDIRDEMAEQWVTVGDVAEYVAKHRS